MKKYTATITELPTLCIGEADVIMVGPPPPEPPLDSQPIDTKKESTAFNGTPKFGDAPIKAPGGYYYDDPEDDPDSALYKGTQ